MASETHIDAYVHKVVDIYNGHDIARFDALLTDDCVLVRNGESAVGRDAVKKVLARLYAAFPDIIYGVEEALLADNRIVMRWTGTGTHRGEYLGIPPTGRSIRYEGITLFERTGDRISHIWVSADMLDLMRKLSAGPTTQPEARA